MPRNRDTGRGVRRRLYAYPVPGIGVATGLVDVRIPPLGTWLSYPLQVMLNLLSPGRTCEISPSSIIHSISISLPSICVFTLKFVS